MNWFTQADEETVYEVDGVEYMVGDFVSFDQLHWSSDWNGDEVGYDDIDVVGLYSFAGTDIYIYVDSSSGQILDMWKEEDDE